MRRLARGTTDAGHVKEISCYYSTAVSSPGIDPLATYDGTSEVQGEGEGNNEALVVVVKAIEFGHGTRGQRIESPRGWLVIVVSAEVDGNHALVIS